MSLPDALIERLDELTEAEQRALETVYSGQRWTWQAEMLPGVVWNAKRKLGILES